MPAFFHPPCRKAPRFRDLINPVWYFSDDTQPINGPSWTWSAWAKRNILSNFTSVVIGVGHLPHYFHAEADTIWRADGKLRLAWTSAWLRPWLPLLSWKSATRERCIGWKTDGSFSITWRVKNAHEAQP
jgi:hypothetical protein